MDLEQKHQLSDQLKSRLIDLEVRRIELLFKNNKYTDQQKRWFIEAKKALAKKEKNEIDIIICERLLDAINSNEANIEHTNFRI